MSQLTRRLLTYLALSSCLLALAFILSYPRIHHLGDGVENRGDPLQTCWMLAWETRKLRTGLTGFFEANSFYPEPHALAHSTHALGLLPLAAPTILVSGNPVLAYNTCFILNIVLSGLAMHALAQRLLSDRLAAVAAGVLFAVAPFRFAQSDHFSRTFTVWMPLVFLFLDKFLVSRKGLDLVLFTLFFNLQALTRYYHAYPLVLGVVWFVLIWHLRRKRWPDYAVGLGLTLFVLVSGAIHLPIARVYREVQRSYDFERPRREVRALSLHLTDFLSAASENKLFGTITERWRSQYPSERSLFPGVTPVLLAIAGLWSAVKTVTHGSWSSKGTERLDRVSGALIYAGMLVLVLLLSFGPEVEAFGIVIPLPYFWLSRYVPGLSGLRAPAKFVTPAFMALTLLAGCGVSFLLDVARSRLGRNQAKLASFALLTFVTLTASLEGWTDQGLEKISVGANRPPVYKWVEGDDRTEVLIELPMRGLRDITDALRETERLFYSTYHWKTLVNGYGSVVPPSYRETARHVSNFPDNESIARLRSIGVDTVVLHRDEFGSDEMSRIWDELPLFHSDLEFVRCWQQDCALYIEDGRQSYSPNTVDVSLDGRIKLAAYALQPRTIGAGEVLRIRLWWQAQEQMDRSFTVFAHLTSPAGEIIAQDDGIPQGGVRPTHRWMKGEVVVDDHYVQVGSQVPRTPAEVYVGMYSLATMERLTVPSDSTGQNRVLLGTVDIE